MSYSKFFWLHIKKSAGNSTRQLLAPHYVEVNRTQKPFTFIQAKPEEYNDVLNNYRVVLGDYQFKRTLFAKEFLYPDDWDNIFSFAFVREPIDRCISMFYYMHYQNPFETSSKLRKAYHLAKKLKNSNYRSEQQQFDDFLDLIEQTHFESNSIFHPAGLHFATHTAPMFADVSDNDGNVLLTKTYRLENMTAGINEMFEQCGIDKRITDNSTVLNKNDQRKKYTPTNEQKAKIVKLFEKDFDLYENAH